MFCAFTFADSDLLIKLGISAYWFRVALGLASILAFLASLVGLRVDWKGRAANHREAALRLSAILAEFRNYRLADGTWAQSKIDDLRSSYWEVMNNIATIPEKHFLKLKAIHIRKMEISRMLDRSPGCPIVFLRLVLFIKSVRCISK
jgi:hypothetical protein